MNNQSSFDPVFSVIKDLKEWFENSDNKFLIIGGIAASLLGRPRTTADIDVLTSINTGKLSKFINSGKKYSFNPRIEEVLEFAIGNKVILMKHEPTSIDIDISLALLPFENEAFERSTLFEISGLKIPLPSKEDLIIMKAVAHRPIDIEDIKAIIEVSEDIDYKRIEYWIKEFSKVLETPEIWDDIKKYLKNLNQ